MQQNAYLLAKISADTAENEENVAENFPKTGNYPTGPLLSQRTVQLPDVEDARPGPVEDARDQRAERQQQREDPEAADPVRRRHVAPGVQEAGVDDVPVLHLGHK